jgi:predicted transcriptional regulator YheO
MVTQKKNVEEGLLCASNDDESKEKKLLQERELIFNTLRQAADTMVSIFPNSLEVVIHDLSKPQKSIHYIAGNITKRKIGGPLTDFAIKILHREGNDIENRCGYKTMTNEGKTLKSSTSFIRNSNGDVVVGFCVNFDITDMLNIGFIVEALTSTANSSHGAGYDETFASSIDETIHALYQQAIAKIGKQPLYMSMEEKVELVGELETSGVFQIKGGVDHVAQLLGVTKYTIYNYLKKIKVQQNISLF